MKRNLYARILTFLFIILSLGTSSAFVRPCLDALRENRFFLARTLYDLILKRVGEM